MARRATGSATTKSSTTKSARKPRRKKASSESQEIVIRGAREHNLRDVSLKLPKNKLIVMTGVSGSGKSSLAFDTLYAEGQRRYVESLSSYARQFLGQMPKPEVDSITGLAPSISIQQKASGRNPRSTVGTITEIYDYLRVLFARVGTQSCYQCGKPVTAQSVEQIIDTITRYEEGTKFQILAPIIQGQKGEYRDLFDDLLKQGFVRARVDGETVQLSEDLKLDRQMRHNIEVVIDRLVAGKALRARLAESVEQALKLGEGSLIVVTDGGKAKEKARTRKGGKSSVQSAQSRHSAASPPAEQLFSSQYACTDCGISFEPPSPQLFSFNSPQGMCHECNGLGQRFEFVVESLVQAEKKSLWAGCLAILGAVKGIGRWRRHIYKGVGAAIETDLDLKVGSFLKTPWKDLPDDAKQLFLFGLGDRHITYEWGYRGGTWKHGGTYDGFIPELLEGYRKTNNPMRRRQLEKHMRFVKCTACKGSRLNRQAAAVTLTTTSQEYLSGIPTGDTSTEKKKRGKKVKQQQVQRPATLNISQICALDILSAWQFFESLSLTETQQYIAGEALKEIRGRSGFLLRCGLSYLTLERTAPTLSGGESQRIRLAGQIGCGLVDVVYILDEPSIGLHPRDNKLLLESLCDLRDQGNTVIVVEHDEETMQAADYIVDFGPGPGVRGGEVVVEGSVIDVKKSKNSVTGQFLSGRRQIEVPTERRPGNGQLITVRGATHHNLQNVDVEFPLGCFICVTGASGSGKSSLVNDILWQTLNRDINKGKGQPGDHESVSGIENVDKAIDIDQSPIGRTPRSNPATYVKLFDLIRDLYSKLPEAKIRGYKPGRFSFNVSGGRCEACEGHGANKLEMDFLADIWVTCPVCEGKRFHHETLEVRFKGKNIAEVLDMDVQEALEHFANVPKIHRLLQTLHDVGLDYLKLGQPSPTLSGGEAQRIKLARELGKRSTGKTIYLLDEPTTGLHFADVEKLLEVLHGFVANGNTVLIVEHNIDVIKTADWVIDIGPEGGSGGGTIVCAGTPEAVAGDMNSHTGTALAPVLGVSRVRGRGKKSRATDNDPARWQTEISRPSNHSSPPSITVRGAEQHNLQRIDLELPRDRMNVFCGPSGSGKTSLAMDTLYAEGQRRYVESLSAYARQFLGQMPKPRVEHIHGLQPSIAIEQKSVGATPRSTVGTVTEIYDYLRILWCRLGTQHCPSCQIPVNTQTTDEVIERLLSLEEGTKLLLLAPQEIRVGQAYERLWDNLREQGFARVRVNGTTHRLEDVPEIDRKRKHNVEVVVDRVIVKSRQRSRIADSVETALGLGQGVMRTALVDDSRDENDWKVDSYSLFRACEECGRSFEELIPNNFSFNSPLGWCEECEGLGVQQGTDLNALLNDPHRSLQDAAVAVWPDPKNNSVFLAMLQAMSQSVGISLDVPFVQLDPVHRRAVLYGTGDRWFEVANQEAKVGKQRKGKGTSLNSAPETLSSQPSFRFQYKGLFPAIEEASRVSYQHRRHLSELVGEIPCSSCDGARTRDDAANIRFQGKTLQQVCETPLDQTLDFLKKIRLTGDDKRVAGDLLEEARTRMSFLVEVGLDYLTLQRSLPTLSGGETQRIRLAGQIGRALTGVLYVLDEPTIGLHPRDNARLLTALNRLRDLGNTMILVEHDREVIASADRVYDFGPGAGRFGGTITEQGTPKQLAARKKSLTGEYLGDKRQILIPDVRRMTVNDEKPETRSKRKKAAKKTQSTTRLGPALSMASPPGGGWLELLGARLNNLRDVNLRIPLGTFTVVTGVSGSGKSSLIEDTLAKALVKHLHRANEQPGPYENLNGLGLVNKAIVVDQAPLGNTPKSNPGTYTGVFDHIRELYCRLPDSKVRGYRPGRFSFNRPGGRCEACEGDGQKKIEMHFLPDVWVECDECRGERYNRETLSVKYRGHSIADVLNLSIGQCLELFDNIPKIRKTLSTLCAIGLDYLTLGQSATTLSGGEAQRVKLAAELARPNTGKTVYILDEPTTGLHFDDIDKLLKVLNSLVEAGNTVIVIEHNLDVIKTADWIVDLGPEAGIGGGWIVAEGTPEDVAKRARDGATNGGNEKRRSHTAEQLVSVLTTGRRGNREVFDVVAEGKKREGDLTMAQVGKDAKMPWEVDGRKWHTRDRIAHSGKPCRWEGDALEMVVEQLTSDRRGSSSQPAVTKKKKATCKKRPTTKAALMSGSDLLKAHEEATEYSETDAQPSSMSLKTIWNDSSTVEVTGGDKRHGWFMHALTRDEWLLKLYFRVQRNCFNQEDLSNSLQLRSVDDINELPIYGRSDRVRVKNKPAGYQEVLISVHWLKEIDTPAFREFLEVARDSYVERVESTSTDVKDVSPWKVLGRKWHLMQKGFPAEKRPKWKKEVLETLLQVFDKVIPDGDVVWNERAYVRYRQPGSTSDWAVICTKRRVGIDLVVTPRDESIGVGGIAGLVTEHESVKAKNGKPAIRLRFDKLTQVKSPKLRSFLKKCL